MSEVQNNGFSSERHQELQKTSGKWSIPETFTVKQANEITVKKIEGVKLESGTPVGQINELSFTTRPGDRQVSAKFILNINPEEYDVITAGPHMWSQSTSVKTSGLLTKILPLPTNRVIGRRPYEESMEDARYSYYEPGDKNKKPSAKEGRSYGFVAFRHKQTGENIMLGTIPDLDTFERISYGMKDGKFVVSVEKDFEGITTPRESAFKVFLGSVYSQQGKDNYANLLEAYAQELTKLRGNIPLLENSVIGFSWPAYGKNINQRVIEEEIEAGKDIVDTYIIDAGWAKPDNVYQVDSQKFPDLPALAKKMREAGIKPGIWIAPFQLDHPKDISEPLKPLKDKKGKPAISPFPIRENYKLPALVGHIFGKNPAALDISIPEVREYISQQFVALTNMGFEVFKLDFLSHAFAAKMEGHDKTSIEYYRQTIQEIRETVKKDLGKDIILIGCGGPWLESIGLFNGSRMTSDSANPLLSKNIPPRRVITKIDERINTYLYRNATAVAARRVLPFRDSFGMIFDGIHIDPALPFGVKRTREEHINPGVSDAKRKVPLDFNKSILALRKLGISNMFVGDSLRNLPAHVKKQWVEFVQSFKAQMLT